MGRPCRNLTVAERRCRHAGCGACVGPFPFAAGPLLLLSRLLLGQQLLSTLLLLRCFLG